MTCSKCCLDVWRIFDVFALRENIMNIKLRVEKFGLFLTNIFKIVSKLLKSLGFNLSIFVSYLIFFFFFENTNSTVTLKKTSVTSQ